MRIRSGVRYAFVLVLACSSLAAQQPAAPRPHNVIIFVADGLRRDSVNAQDTPALWRVRKNGIDFPNSHSVYPTFTTANASAIATGHGLGDTGDFSNALWVAYPLFESGNFKRAAGVPVPYLEDNQVLSDLDDGGWPPIGVADRIPEADRRRLREQKVTAEHDRVDQRSSHRSPSQRQNANHDEKLVPTRRPAVGAADIIPELARCPTSDP